MGNKKIILLYVKMVFIMIVVMEKLWGWSRGYYMNGEESGFNRILRSKVCRGLRIDVGRVGGMGVRNNWIF